MSFVISAEYGELLDGYNVTQDELSTLVRIPWVLWSGSAEERFSMLLQERAEWQAAMKRCPMFVQGEGRA